MSEVPLYARGSNAVISSLCWSDWSFIGQSAAAAQKKFFIDNRLVRIHFIVVMMRQPHMLLCSLDVTLGWALLRVPKKPYSGTLLMRKRFSLKPCSKSMPMVLQWS